LKKASLKRRLQGLYDQLFAAYGQRGWWPVPGSTGRRGFDSRGYHPGDFAHPRTPAGRFEVIMGAVLTQNTAWTNADAALTALRHAGIRLPSHILSLPHRRLAALVRSSGYFNQKASKLRTVAALFARPRGLTPGGAPSREALLSEWGIGPETADSILLYAFHTPVFVVDAYTRRILTRIGLIDGPEAYDDIQALFHDALAPDPALYNEYHALIVQHAKTYCMTRPECRACPVRPCRHRSVAMAARSAAARTADARA
jgi:endonuclease III related protein